MPNSRKNTSCVRKKTMIAELQGCKVVENGGGSYKAKAELPCSYTEMTPSIFRTYVSNIINAETVDKS